MALVRHPIDSYNVTINFWEEFPDYKANPDFNRFWRENKKAGFLEASSKFMWLLTLCYDRKSSMFGQPESDKWEGSSDIIFGDEFFMKKVMENPDEVEDVILLSRDPSDLINAFERSIDTPQGMALRLLEKKLADRTKFVMSTPYTLDYFDEKTGKPKKGTADQLDRMFTNTDKINALIKKAMDDLAHSESVGGAVKGGERESLSDGNSGF